eukprot:scaffold22833_cov134-Isochrysis_galbana.AAC.7
MRLVWASLRRDRLVGLVVPSWWEECQIQRYSSQVSRLGSAASRKSSSHCRISSPGLRDGSNWEKVAGWYMPLDLSHTQGLSHSRLFKDITHRGGFSRGIANPTSPERAPMPIYAPMPAMQAGTGSLHRQDGGWRMEDGDLVK